MVVRSLFPREASRYERPTRPAGAPPPQGSASPRYAEKACSSGNVTRWISFRVSPAPSGAVTTVRSIAPPSTALSSPHAAFLSYARNASGASQHREDHDQRHRNTSSFPPPHHQSPRKRAPIRRWGEPSQALCPTCLAGCRPRVAPPISASAFPRGPHVLLSFPEIACNPGVPATAEPSSGWWGRHETVPATGVGSPLPESPRSEPRSPGSSSRRAAVPARRRRGPPRGSPARAARGAARERR